jgi:hypothetical protein
MAILKSEFDVLPDQIEFRTKTNGDRIDIKFIHLGQQNAQELASLINSGKTITVIIKEKVE